MPLNAATVTKMLQAAGASTSGLVASPATIADLYNQAVAKYAPGQFDTPAKMAALLSETMMESAYFRTTVEYATTGPYQPFRGRTFVQLTWGTPTGGGNYGAFGRWAKSKGLVSDPLVFCKNPTALGELQWAALGPVFYFTQVKFSGKPLTEYATNILQVGRAVNLGNPFSTATPNGQRERTAAYNAILPLRDQLLPKVLTPAPQFHVGGTAIVTSTSTALARTAPGGNFVTRNGKRLGHPKGAKFKITKLGKAKDGSDWVKGPMYWYAKSKLACYGTN